MTPRLSYKQILVHVLTMALQFRNSGNSAVSLLCLQLQHDFEAKIALNSLQTFEEEKLQKIRRNNSVLRVHRVGCIFSYCNISTDHHQSTWNSFYGNWSASVGSSGSTFSSSQRNYPRWVQKWVSWSLLSRLAENKIGKLLTYLGKNRHERNRKF